VNGNVSGGGVSLISGHAIMECGSAVDQNVMLIPDASVEGTLLLDYSADFRGGVAGCDRNDVLDFAVNHVFKSFDETVNHCCYAWNTLIDQP
jgi:hypothetical protein